MSVYPVYPVGVPGTPWGPAERAQWLALQTKKRDYFTEVVSPLSRVSSAGVEVFQYGTLDYGALCGCRYPLYAAKSTPWVPLRPMMLVTGGVHGYETSGVQGALLYIQKHMASSASKVNILVLPCVSPWGYETVNRWTPHAIDPNRSFVPGAPGCPEAMMAMACIFQHVTGTGSGGSPVLAHTDLHETTDTDNSEFTPAKTARDGAPTPPWDPIPDGFYLVGDTTRPEPAFQKAIIDAVAKVTHIADPDERGTIIGEKVAQHGVVNYDGKPIGLCGSHTAARFSTTTEVYPDSLRPGTTPEQCNLAQAAVVVAALEYALTA